MTAIPAYATADQATAPWQHGALAEPQRHPSRARQPYRARGTGRTPLTRAQVWPPLASAAADRKRVQQRVLVGGTFATVAIAYALMPDLREPASVSPQPMSVADPLVAQTNMTALSPPESRLSTPVAIPATESRVQNANGADRLPSVTLPVAPAQMAASPAPPVAQTQPPTPQTPTARQTNTVVFPESALRPLTAAPLALSPPEQETTFACRTCTAAFPQFGQVSFTIFAADPESPQIRTLANNLGAYEMTVAPPSIPVMQNAVRFYRKTDAAAATELAAIYDAALVDLTWFAPETEIARIEVMFAPALSPQP